MHRWEKFTHPVHLMYESVRHRQPSGLVMKIHAITCVFLTASLHSFGTAAAQREGLPSASTDRLILPKLAREPLGGSDFEWYQVLTSAAADSTPCPVRPPIRPFRPGIGPSGVAREAVAPDSGVRRSLALTESELSTIESENRRCRPPSRPPIGPHREADATALESFRRSLEVARAQFNREREQGEIDLAEFNRRMAAYQAGIEFYERARKALQPLRVEP